MGPFVRSLQKSEHPKEKFGFYRSSLITQFTLSKFFGISVDVIGKLIRKETWKYIDDIEFLPKNIIIYLYLLKWDGENTTLKLDRNKKYITI
jgi:hypothetical protein